ncbi:MAG: hypothetical protein Q8Q52_05045 [Acidimicrobiia bacterium]|nr:hypothetical protein [Acidimicrobiia bacterium]
MKERIAITRALMLISVVVAAAAWTVAGAALSVDADPLQTEDVIDITAEANSCFKPLGYQLTATTVVRDNISEESIGFGPSTDFEGGKWNLEDSITLIEGGKPGLTPTQALDRCAGELTASRGYGVNQIEERPAPPALTAAIGDCMTKAGFGPDRITIKVLEIGESGQMRIDTTHFLPESELKPFEQALSTCMISHLEPATGEV